MDSKPVSVKIKVAPDPRKYDKEISENLNRCELDYEAMRYHPIKIRFYHYDKQTALRKLLWHEDDLDTNVRFCPFFDSYVFTNTYYVFSRLKLEGVLFTIKK